MTLQYILWGATWANNVAALEWTLVLGILGAVSGWLARDHIGRHLAAWWDLHHGPYAVRRHKQALAEHEVYKRGSYSTPGAYNEEKDTKGPVEL